MPLVTTTEMFKKAYAGGYAIGAFNVNNMEIIQGIVEAATEEQAPLILQVSSGARKYANTTYLTKMVEAAVETSGLPICLHLDHGDSFALCKDCVDSGFTSVMIDASAHPFAENISITKQVVEYAHDHGVVVEAELGKLAGIEDAVNVAAKDAQFTDPDQVEEFVGKTGVDSLAIAIGTSHGAYKFKGQPQLRFDILEEVSKRLPGFPIVCTVPRPSRKSLSQNQPIRRQHARRTRRPRRYAPQSSVHGSVQDQHRLRPQTCSHRRNPRALCSQSFSLRSSSISRTGKRSGQTSCET